MKKSLLGIVLLLAAAAALYLVFYQPPAQEPTQAVGVAEQQQPVEPTEPAIRYPVPEPQAPAPGQEQEQAEQKPAPLPALQQSDETIQETLAGMSDAKGLEELFVLKNFIQRVVVTIDNLPRPTLPVKQLPTRPPAGSFITATEAGGEVIGPDNHRRYAPYVKFAESLDSQALVATYVHYYPLFQEAYRELGYPKGYFNDRLIEVIDHLLETPRVEGPIRLVRPKILYHFADPALESLSAGQKLLLRSGADNAERIKAKLREIRRVLVTRISSR
ncbi:hypothetical protein DESUT3_09350 [Desulfuromonas versatilis]|uniref:DUF3014 domain-containing protein n=1 Tax=Desulfuromonas versatilis TaxID=2802975 RepID=A0ABM8HT49_9BACT|nr:DUF3014 domain-containing protein [Desulfuromonas versatilis]BCR03866.1 hypothetical protein DESUT3_09350 [Desulfuromonas versatilis]